MKSLFVTLLIFFGGCAFKLTGGVASDYITGLQEPLEIAISPLSLPRSPGGVRLVDRNGREAHIYYIWVSGDAEGQTVLALVLASARGRHLDYAGEEGAVLLRVLDAFKSDDEFATECARSLSDLIRKKRTPNQAPEPTSGLRPAAAHL